MNRTHYVRHLDADVRYRVEFVLDHGQVSEFVAQLEVVEDDEWRPVVRYDTAHGFAHCDRYRSDGSVQRHERLPVDDFGLALTWSTQIIRDNWEEIILAFRKKTE